MKRRDVLVVGGSIHDRLGHLDVIRRHAARGLLHRSPQTGLNALSRHPYLLCLFDADSTAQSRRWVRRYAVACRTSGARLVVVGGSFGERDVTILRSHASARQYLVEQLVADAHDRAHAESAPQAAPPPSLMAGQQFLPRLTPITIDPHLTTKERLHV